LIEGANTTTSIKQRVVIPGDGAPALKENKLQILETSDGEIIVSITTYDYQLGRHVAGGVVRFKPQHTGGRKQVLLAPLRVLIDQALELMKAAPGSRIEGWGK
jgi:hypothetical protein